MKRSLLPCLLALILLFVTGCDVEVEGGEIYVEGDEAGECDDGIDNNQDGILDCDDVGCVNAVVCNDADGDGLSNAFEESIGTDINNADTDGDGFTDSQEYLTYFSPVQAIDAPYLGGYPRGPLPNDADWAQITQAAGWAEGDISANWSISDQHNQELHLERFYGNVILIVVCAEWTDTCREGAEALEDAYQTRREDGFIIIQLLMDGLTMGDRNPNGDRWVSEFGQTFPVLEDGEMRAVPHYIPDGSFGVPNYTVIDREHRISSWYATPGEPDWALIDQLLMELPPTVNYPMPSNAAELQAKLGIDPNSWLHPFGD